MIVGQAQASTAGTSPPCGWSLQDPGRSHEATTKVWHREANRDKWSSTPLGLTNRRTREARSSDQALRGDFSWQPQQSRPETAGFASGTLATHTPGFARCGHTFVGSCSRGSRSAAKRFAQPCRLSVNCCQLIMHSFSIFSLSVTGSTSSRNGRWPVSDRSAIAPQS